MASEIEGNANEHTDASAHRYRYVYKEHLDTMRTRENACSAYGEPADGFTSG